jgi:hypothetical protein
MRTPCVRLKQVTPPPTVSGYDAGGSARGVASRWRYRAWKRRAHAAHRKGKSPKSASRWSMPRRCERRGSVLRQRGQVSESIGWVYVPRKLREFDAAARARGHATRQGGVLPVQTWTCDFAPSPRVRGHRRRAVLQRPHGVDWDAVLEAASRVTWSSKARWRSRIRLGPSFSSRSSQYRIFVMGYTRRWHRR